MSCISPLLSNVPHSDTSFDVFDYNADVLRLIDEINPGQANVGLCVYAERSANRTPHVGDHAKHHELRWITPQWKAVALRRMGGRDHQPGRQHPLLRDRQELHSRERGRKHR